MKTKLFTKNIVLGILVTLVLAFSVQGTADALKFGTSRSGDLEPIFPSREFTISFSVSLGSNTTPIKNNAGKLVDASDTPRRIDSSGYLVTDNIGGKTYRNITTNPSGNLVIDPRPRYNNDTPSSAGSPAEPYYVDTSKNVVDSNGKAVYVQTGTGTPDDPSTTGTNESDPWQYTRAKAEPTPKIADSLRYHYNAEQIGIVVPTNLTLTKVGNYDVNVGGGSTHTMQETIQNASATKLSSGTIRLTFRTSTNLGKYQIGITDTTPPADRPTNAARPLGFTIYVIPLQDTNTTFDYATNDRSNNYEIGNDNGPTQINTLFAVGTENRPLTYEVSSGSGRLYIEESYTGDLATAANSKGRSMQKLPTSSAAAVYLDMNRSSNEVTAYISTQNALESSKSLLIINLYAQIEITSGNNQTGVPNARLIEPLGIRVKDSKGRALSGLAVTFDANNGATLQPVIGTDVYLTNPPTENTWAIAFSTNVEPYSATATVPAAISEDAPAAVPTDRSGEAEVYLKLGAIGNKTITVSTGGATKTFYATSSLSTDIPTLEIFSGNNQKSAANGKVKDPLVVRVLAGNSSPFPAQTVTFTTTKGYLTTTTTGTTVTATTDVNGKAEVTYDLVNHLGASDVIAEIKGTSPDYQRRVTFNINGSGGGGGGGGNTITRTLDIGVSGTGNTRTVTVSALQNAASQTGILVNLSVTGTGATLSTGSGLTPLTSTLTLPATAAGTYTLNASTTGNVYTADTETITVGDTGGSGTETISVSPTSLSGAGGAVVQLRVLAGTTPVTVTGDSTFTTAGGLVSPTGATRNVTLPRTEGFYSLTISATGYTTETILVTVTGAATTAPTAATGTLSITLSGARSGNQQAIRVAAQPSPSSALVVTLSGVTNPPTLTIPVGESSMIRVATLPTTTGAHTLTANADGYNSGSVTVPATRQQPPEQPPQQQPPAGGTPDSIQIRSEPFPSGPVNTQLADPLTIRVLDSNGNGVANVRVTFQVRTGQGRLSQRGNGRAVRVTTNSSGEASAPYTPMSANSRVRATAAGVSQTVTFTITADGSETPATTPGTGDTPGIKPIEPKVLIGAANRPAMYWIDSGMLYGLTGAKAEKIADSVNGAAVGGGKVYWTEMKEAGGGTVNSANLDGTGVKQLAAILAVPMGIAVDTADQKLYWTNSRGRIQSADLDGSGIKNVRQNLSDPTDIALSDTHIYWVASGDTIRRVNMTGTRVVKDVAVGLKDVGGIAVGGGKVYWTEATGASAGTINGANADGTQFKTLATIKAAPMGIAVDTADQKLYWTNSRGRVQRANLNGSKIQNVVDGLGSPSHIAIGGSTSTTATKPATKPTETQQPKKDTAKYDVNGDGTVDNVDASLVSGAMGTNTAKYDVNGDGTVNFLDLLLVFDNRDEGAAGAPTIVGIKLSAAQIDVLQEQIDLLIATGDRSPAAMRTLIYLQQLIATARPEKTQLLANYPNPFNPETWIPYELADATQVKITIYNTQGVVIRTLELGHQSAGYYTGRERAAYWDGRNAFGEQVASGIYFYQFETDTMSAMRKMVILK